MTTPDSLISPPLPWLEALPDPTVLVDPADGGRVRSANVRAVLYFGRDLPALRAGTLEQLIPELAAQEPGAAPQALRLAGAGPWAWVDVRRFPVGDLLAVQLSDATAQHVAETSGRVLSDLTAALSRALSREEAAEVVLRQGRAALAAASASVFWFDPVAEELVPAGTCGDNPAGPGPHCSDAASTLVAEALQSGQPLFLGATEVRARLRQDSGVPLSAVAVPLMFGARALGVVHFGFVQDREFGGAERQFVQAVAGQLAQAVERVRLAAAERTAREQATCLLHVGERLLTQQDPVALLGALARLAVEGQADWCAVYTERGGALLPQVFAHRDPQQQQLAAEYLAAFPQWVDGPGPLALAYRENRVVRVPVITPEMVQALDLPGEQLALLQAMQVRSSLAVPLVVGGQRVGVLSLVRVGGAEPYQEPDEAFAQEFARRASLALSHARLTAEREAALAEAQLERARLTASQARYQALIEATAQYVWTNSPDGEMFGEQPGWAQLTGQTQPEYQGYGWADRLHPEDRGPAVDAWRDAVRTRTLYQIEQRVRVADGSYRSFLVRAVPLLAQDHSLREWVGLHSDITELKRAEQTLQAWGRELERQVEAQTRELRAANEELGAFVYTVSHDLRAPVRHVGSFAGLLRRKIGDHPGLLKYVDQIEGAATRMEVLTDALLGLARTGAAQLAKTPVDLSVLVDAVCADLAPDLHGRQVTWRVADLPAVQADAGLLRQVMANLLGNAVKYSRGRGHTVIEVRAQETPQEVVVAVQDNGVGFDPQYTGKLFGVFQRLHHHNEFEGTGVGLANVRRIVEKHGGRVWAEGRPGEGATFFFSLPRG
ncbi:ATP-binding protein [Deinococcus aerophilus]|nr:ATP-binding protein [Deinococcus aerophilus]